MWTIAWGIVAGVALLYAITFLVGIIGAIVVGAAVALKDELQRPAP